MSRKITIEFLGDSKDLQRSMDDADSKGGKLTGTLGKVGKAAAVGLAAGAAAGAVGLFKLTQGAIEDEAAQKKLEKQLQNSAGATDAQVAAAEDWITAQGKALGVTDDELRPALAKLATATKDVSEAQDLATLAMDASAGTGKSLEAVSLALMKARNGDIAGLSRLGIATKDAEGKTLSFEQVTKNMAATFGGQAATQAGTLEGKMDRLKLILAETGETIGSKLIPKVTQAADWFLNQGLPAAESFGGWMRDNLVPILTNVGATVSSIAGFLREHTTAVVAATVALGALVVVTQVHAAAMAVQAAGGLAAMIKGLPIVTTLTKVWTAVQWAANAALAANPIGLVVGALVLLGAGLAVAWAKSETFREVVTGALDRVRSVASTVAGFFRTTLPEFFRESWDKAKTWTTNGVEQIVTWVQGIPGRFAKALGSLTATVRGIFDDAMNAGREKVATIGATIVGWVADIPGKLREKIDNFKSAGAALIGGFVDGLKNAGGVIEGIAGNVWNAVKSLLNSAIDKINAKLNFTISIPGPDIHINAGQIPHLAKGGLVTKPTLALIGEDGPEAVVPLGAKNRPRGLMPALGGGAGGATVVQLVLPGGRILEQILIQHTRDTGEPLQVRTLGPA